MQFYALTVLTGYFTICLRFLAFTSILSMHPTERYINVKTTPESVEKRKNLRVI